MNKVYKVVWNEMKNGYSVVSEIAKSHGKSSSCCKKAVTAVMVLSLLSAGGLAYAQDPATPAPEPDNGVHFVSINHGVGEAANPKSNWNNDGAKGSTSIAVGQFAQATDVDGAAFGKQALAQGGSALALGTQAQTNGNGAAALGTATEAQANRSTAIGLRAVATQEGGVALGANSKADTVKGKWGFNVSENTEMTLDALLGDKKTDYDEANNKLNELRNQKKDLENQLSESRKADILASEDIPIESEKTKNLESQLDDKRKEIVAQIKVVNDYTNAWKATEAAVSVGNAEVGSTRQITGVAAGTEDTDAVNVAQIKAITKQMEAQATHYFSVNSNDSAEPADTNWNNDGAKGVAAIAVGPRAGAQGDYGTAVGAYAQAGGSQSSAFGVAAKATGAAATAAGTNAVAGGASAAAFGSQAKATGTASTAIGLLAQAKSNESVAVGAYTVAENHAAALGPQAQALGEQSVAVGGKAEAQAAHSLAIGSLANATQKGGVALGASSLADRQAGVWGFDVSAGKAMDEDTLLGEKKAERAQEIDKLNGLGRELKQLRTDLEESIKKDPVGQDGKRIPSDKTKQIQENLKNKTAEFNAQFKLVNGYVNAWQSFYGAVSVGNAEVGVTRQITGVAAGTEDTDVVNVAQLKAVVKDVNTEAAKHTTVAAGKNITVDEGTNDNGGKAYTVKLNDTLTELKSVETEEITVGGKLTIDKDGLKTGDVTIKEDGIHAGDKVITGVADGVNPTDAVNMRQLGALDNQVKTNTTNISLLNGRVDMLDNRVNRVGAGAAALAGLHPLDYDSENKWDFAAGYGNYKGANAVAIGVYYRPNEDTMFSVGGSFGGGENMVNAGVSVKLGQGTGISTSKAAMANEIRELKARDREREAQMQEIMRQLEILQRQAGK